MWPLLVVAVSLVPFGVALRVHHFGRRASKRLATGLSADAIVVLGASVLPGGVASNALRARVERAVALFHSRAAPLVIFTGGRLAALPSEASVACELAVSLGVPREACVLDELSLSTVENARETRRIAQERRLTALLLVTDDYHLLRATALFRAHALTVHPVAASRPMAWRDRVYWTAREALALLRRPWQIG